MAKLTKEQLQGAISIASKYAPEGGESAPPKTLVQEIKRRNMLRRRRRADEEKLKKLKAKKKRNLGSQYSANADKVLADIKAGKYD